MQGGRQYSGESGGGGDDPKTKGKTKVSFLNAHKDGVTGLRFADENSLISAGNDAVINTWMVT